MATAAVLSAIAVGIALILLPAPTVDGLNHGLSAAAGQRRTVTQRVREWPAIKRLLEWSKEPAEPAGSRQPGWVKKAARRIASVAVRQVVDPPDPPRPKPFPMGTLAWQAWVAAVVAFAVIPGVATFNAVTLFPDTAACSTEFSAGVLRGTLIATNAGWAYRDKPQPTDNRRGYRGG